MIGRNVEVVIFAIDHRVLTNLQCRMDAVAGFNYLVDALLKKHYPNIQLKTKKKAKKHQIIVF